MTPRSSVKPLELVISAIHCLKERRGSSPQDILRYLLGKYHVDPNSLKTHVQAGLKRGLSFGLINQRAGLYRLNDILSPTIDPPISLKKSPKSKPSKTSKILKKPKVKKAPSKKTKRHSYQHMGGSFAQKGRRKTQKKKSARNRSLGIRGKNVSRRRKQKRRRTKTERVKRLKLEKASKIKPEKAAESVIPSAERPGSQRCSVDSKEPENVKNNVKT